MEENKGHKWKPGESGNPNGRPKGTGGNSRQRWNEMATFILEEGTKKFIDNLKAETSSKKFNEDFLAILNYLKPKMSTSRVVMETPPPIQLIDARTYITQNGKSNGADKGTINITPDQPDLLGE